MWEGSYGKEPFDLRLTVLRLLRKFWLVLTATLGGTLLFGGGYYVKNILLQPEPDYRAISVYRVDYAVAEEKDIGAVYINEMTWNTYMDTQLFHGQVRQYLPADMVSTDTELTDAVSAVVASDLRVLSTVVTTDSSEKSLAIAGAVESALVRDLPSAISEVSAITVMDPAQETQAVYPDVRPVRALVLSALLSFFFAVVVFLLKELGDDAVWLPVTLRQRYGLRVVGTIQSRVFAENMNRFFEGMKHIAVCPVQEKLDARTVSKELRAACKGSKVLQEGVEWMPVASPLSCPEGCRKLRESEGVLLVVAAGSHAGKQLEYVLEFLSQQDCKVTSVILWDADELLLKWYYWLEIGNFPMKDSCRHGRYGG